MNENYIEIFSEKLDGWVVLTLNEFYDLIKDKIQNEFIFQNLIGNDKKFRIVGNKNRQSESEHDINNVISKDDYIEIKEKLLLKSEQLNFTLDHLNGSEHNVWTRAKVIFTNDKFVIVSINNKFKKVSYSDVRLLSESLAEKHQNLDFKIKKINLNIETQVKNEINQELANYINTNDIFYEFSNNEFIIISDNSKINFIVQFLLIKINEKKQLEEIQNKINSTKINLEKMQSIITSNKKVEFAFHKEYLPFLKIKRLDKINENDVSFIIQESKEKINYFNLIIFDNLNGVIDMNKYKKLFSFKEDNMKIDSKLKELLTSRESLDELEKIINRTNIVIIYFNNRLDFILITVMMNFTFIS